MTATFSLSRPERALSMARGLFPAGVAVAAAILAYEHQLVKPGDLSRLNTAFFTMNGVISIILFLFAVVDRIA